LRKLPLLFVAFTAIVLMVPSVAAATTPTTVPGTYRGFTHGIVLTVDGDDYYFAGAPDGPGGAVDVPGHYWRSFGHRFVIGLHFNTGPFGMPSWWSSDAPDGSLLFIVIGIIDTWTPEKAEWYSNRGYVHYHEFVKVSDGSEHPTKVIWLKHIAVRSFNFDGGPRPDLGHEVTPGVDFDFMPNYMMPYPHE
jgi:selenium-binding protein 1